MAHDLTNRGHRVAMRLENVRDDAAAIGRFPKRFGAPRIRLPAVVAWRRSVLSSRSLGEYPIPPHCSLPCRYL